MSHHDDHDDHHDHKGCGSSAHSRRAFLKGALFSSFGLIGSSVGLPTMSFAQTAGGKTLIKIFMRGGADGMSLFPPFGDMNYYTQRPNVNIDAPSSQDPNAALPLMGKYGMNPNLRSLKEIWDTGNMAISMATHFNEGNRSHFDCMRWIELGSTQTGLDGMFNRYLQNVAGANPLRAVRAGSSNQAASMGGRIVVPSISDSGSYSLTNYDWCGGANCSDNELTKTLQAMGAVPVGPAIEQSTRRVQSTMVDTIATVQAASKDYQPTANGMQYADGQNGRQWTSMGNGLKLVAQLLKAGVPLEIAAIDWGGHWDTHENQYSGGVIDQNNGHAKHLKLGADNLLTFWRDLGPALRKNVIVMVGSEFGRTVRENGSLGTDHGGGGAWFAFGGSTKGGIYGDLPALTDANTPDNKVPTVLNYKDMLGEALSRHMGVSSTVMSNLFPGHTFTNHNMFTASV